MQCGISTACFFPETTLESLKILAGHGVRVVELFLNTFSELDDDYVARLQDVQQAYGMRVSSVHPFTGMLEGFFFASEYGARVSDGQKLYRRYYETAARLGANRLVFHGDHEYNLERFPFERYADNFIDLARVGAEYGVTLCQENVAYCRCSDPAAVRKLNSLLGEYSAFVLDLKQARRRNTGIYALLDAMGRDVMQVHISDGSDSEECLPPGRGEFDFIPFIDKLSTQGYNGDLIIELYRDNYEGIDDLLAAKRQIENILRRGYS